MDYPTLIIEASKHFGLDIEVVQSIYNKTNDFEDFINELHNKKE